MSDSADTKIFANDTLLQSICLRQESRSLREELKERQLKLSAARFFSEQSRRKRLKNAKPISDILPKLTA